MFFVQIKMAIEYDTELGLEKYVIQELHHNTDAMISNQISKVTLE